MFVLLGEMNKILKNVNFKICGIPKMVLVGTRFSDILPWVTAFNTSESPFNGDSDPSRFELVKVNIDFPSLGTQPAQMCRKTRGNVFLRP